MTKLQMRNTRSAKLTPMDVLEIRRRAGEGESQSKLCVEFQVSLTQIGRIVRGESWQGLRPTIPSDVMIRGSADKIREMFGIPQPNGVSRLQQEAEKLPEVKTEKKLDDFLGDK